MGLLEIIIILCVVGLLLWAVNAYLPIPQPIKNIVLLLIVVFFCVWLLSLAGFGGHLNLR